MAAVQTKKCQYLFSDGIQGQGVEGYGQKGAYYVVGHYWNPLIQAVVQSGSSGSFIGCRVVGHVTERAITKGERIRYKAAEKGYNRGRELDITLLN